MAEEGRRGFLKGLMAAGVASMIPKNVFAKDFQFPYPIVVLNSYPLTKIKDFFDKSETNIDIHRATRIKDEIRKIQELKTNVSESYLALLKSITGKKEIDIVKQIQLWFNNNQNVFYKYDMGDNWETLFTFIKNKGGDCEDHAFAKRLTMIAGKVDDSKIFIVTGYEFRAAMINGVVGHTILLIEMNGNYYVLENSYDTGESLIELENYLRVTYYQPSFILNFKKDICLKVKINDKFNEERKPNETFEERAKKMTIRKLLGL